MVNITTSPDNYILANRFYVEMERQLTASFVSCEGLGAKIDTTVFKEGGVNDQQRILLGPASFTEVTLSRGMSDSLLFWNWVNDAIYMARTRLRRNVNILTFNQAGETMQCWTLIAAIPTAWKTPSLKADSTSAAIEQLTLNYEGLQVTARTGGGSGSTVGMQRNRRTGYFDT